jgi:hypothetical protein
MRHISVPLPFGRRIHFALDRGGAIHPAGFTFGTSIRARHITMEARDVLERIVGRPVGRIDFEQLGTRDKQLVKDLTRLHLIEEHDLGSGLVTNIGAMAIANEAFSLAAPSGARINTLFLSNWHATGTGVTAAATPDFKLQTISTQGGQTPVAGTQSIDSTTTGAVPKYKTVATISYGGSEAVTEWGLFTSNTLSSTTGTPLTNATATTFTATGTPFTASSATVQGLQQQIIIPGTTAVYGVIQSNTTSVGTLVNNGTTGWWTQAAGAAGSTPGNTEAYTLRPIMWDHKVFSAINVGVGDSIQFTYTLTVTSGG